MPAHTDVGSPSTEHQMRHLLATLYVASSLALVALSCSNPSSGFRLRTLSFSRPSPAIGGPLEIQHLYPLLL
jgi:hypothetical protein